MEALQDVERLGAVLLNELQVRLPHIRADELDLLGEFFADHGEEPLEALGRTLNLRLSDENVNLATYTTALTASGDATTARYGNPAARPRPAPALHVPFICAACQEH